MKIVFKDFEQLSKAELIAAITQDCEGFEIVFFNDLDLIAALEP